MGKRAMRLIVLSALNKIYINVHRSLYMRQQEISMRVFAAKIFLSKQINY